jgi:predicted secreted Zn-dependent protease
MQMSFCWPGRAFFPFLASLAAVACAPGSRPSAAAPPAGFAGVHGVTVRYYDVDGTTAREIRGSMDARRPRDSHDGQAVEAVTDWQISWMVPQSGNSCDLARAAVGFTAGVLLPRLRNPDRVAPDLLDRWRAFIAGLERHEAYHVRHAYERRDEVLRAIRASDCSGANRAAEVAVRRIQAEQRAHDVATRHGADQVPPFP